MISVTEVLSNYGDSGAHLDVVAYLQDEFGRIKDSQRHKYIMQFVPEPWPSGEVIARIAEKSGGCFIYTATVIRCVDEEHFSCLDQLDQVLGTSAAPHGPDEMPFAGLDNLYNTVLSAWPRSLLPLLKRVLSFLQFNAMVLTIEVFLGLRPGQVNLTLRGLRSIVDVDVGGKLRSFFDFLFDPARAKDYHVDIEQWHASNFHRLFSSVNRLMPVLEPDGPKLVQQTIYSHHLRYNQQEIETCIIQCSQQASNIKSLRDVIANSLQRCWWWEDLSGSCHRSFVIAVMLLLEMINALVCHDNSHDETL